MRTLILLALVTLVGTGPVLAQRAPARTTITLSGVTFDAEAGEALPGVNVSATLAADSARTYGTISGADGRFDFAVPARATYRLRFSFVGYVPVERELVVGDSAVDLGTLRLTPDVLALEQLQVEAVEERVVVRGDTTEFNAEAFKVNPDASAEDLVGKLPGVTVEGGQVQAQGEQVRRVLVDGREFFGDDPAAALKNLPAEIIDKIQVFDKQSDQAAFTGFDDGNGETTINIVTREGRSNGQFGRAYGGLGSESRYVAGLNGNFFDGARRVSVIGMTNNVNQQNFASEDLLGVTGGSRGGGGRGGRGGRGGGGNASDFRIDGSGGVSTTHALGVNYIDAWGEKVRVSGSYFFNLAENVSDVSLDREYLLDDDTQRYSEFSNGTSSNQNHRFNLRLNYDLTENTSVVFTPRVSMQLNDAQSELIGLSALASGLPLNATTNAYGAETSGYTASTNLLVRHRLGKEGRTISANFSASANDRTGESDLYASNTFGGALDSAAVVDQRTERDDQGRALSVSLNYTEPIREHGQLQLSYRPSVSSSDADRRVNALDLATGAYTILDPSLSNVYESRTIGQRGGLSYRYRGAGGLFLSAGVDVQHERLAGDRTFPTDTAVRHTFLTVLPNAMLRYRFDRTSNLRLFFRTNTDTPSITQLQDVVDNTNPLLLSSGNPDLRPSTSRSLNLRYNTTDAEGGRTFMVYANLSATDDRIGSASIVAVRDTLLTTGVLLPRGAQYTRPVNLDGYLSGRSFVTYSLPSKLLGSTVNLNGGYGYSRAPGLVNGVENVSNAHSVNGGLGLGSNLSERLDFNASYSASWTAARNSVYPERDNAYTQHRVNLRLNWLPTSAWVLDTSFGASHYGGLGAAYDATSVLWNAGLGYKFLKGNGGQVKLTVFDLLGQTNAVQRTISDLYIEDQSSNVLGRYVMLNFIYTLRNFGGVGR